MYNISCLRTFGPLPRPVLTNPNPLHHPRVLPARADATSHWRKSDGCFVRPTYCWVYVI